MKTIAPFGLFAIAGVLIAAISACSGGPHAPAATGATAEAVVPAATSDVPSPGPMPTGAEGALISYGRDIIHDTPHFAGKYIRAGMSCEACHLAAGTQIHGGSLRGIYATFPQYNKRSKHFIALQDRLAECFLYSMNGTPPAYSSHEMIALTAYIAYLSKGAPVGTGFSGQGFVHFKPDRAPSVSAGERVYGTKCSACHGANGAGVGTFPPLWGPRSFNSGAGMHRLTTMSAFVRYNMPFGSAPYSLSKRDAYDVSAFVLSHPRPAFDKTRAIVFPPQRADTF